MQETTQNGTTAIPVAPSTGFARLEQLLSDYQQALGATAAQWNLSHPYAGDSTLDLFYTDAAATTSTWKRFAGTYRDKGGRIEWLRLASKDKHQVSRFAETLVGLAEEQNVDVDFSHSLTWVTEDCVHFARPVFEFMLQARTIPRGVGHPAGQPTLPRIANELCLSTDKRSDIGVFDWVRHHEKALGGASCTVTPWGYTVTVHTKKDVATLQDLYASSCNTVVHTAGRGGAWQAKVDIIFEDVAHLYADWVANRSNQALAKAGA